MGIKKFKVEFDNPNRCFFPGQHVVGRVILEFKKQKEITGLWVNFEGKATVSWSDKGVEATGSGSKQSIIRKTIYYRGIEPYFKTQLLLIGWNPTNNGNEGSSKQRDVKIPAGTSAYSFIFTLPQGIPSSYVGKSGQVYYSAEVVLSIGKAEHKQRLPFTVNGILDLNHELGMTQEATFRKYKSIGCLCCHSGPVGFIFKLPKKGYVPGEPIKFEVEISNQSSRVVKAVSLSLIQSVSFHAKGNTFYDVRTIRKVNGPEVSRGETVLWDKDFLQIPPIPPTRLTNCLIIDLQHVLGFEMEVSGIGGRKLTGETPIVIGTIPLRSIFPYLRPPVPVPLVAVNIQPFMTSSVQQVQMVTNSSNITQSEPIAPFEDYPDLPPPTYEQAMRFEIADAKGVTNFAYKPGSRAIDDTADVLDLSEYEVDRNFTPLYITYPWPNTTQ